MKENTKRSITLVYSILLIILAAVFTVITVMPIVTFEESRVKYEKEYYTGAFTIAMDKSDDLEIGLKSVIDFVINFSDAQKIVRVQAGNESVDDAERERLAEKLDENKGLSNSVRLFYAFGGMFDEDTNEETDLDTGKLGTGKMTLAIDILKVILLICIIGIGIIFSIITIIKFIIFLIKSLIHLKDDSDTDVDNRMDKFSFVSYTAIMVMFYMIYALVSVGGNMGLAIKGAMLVFIIACALRAIKTIVFAEKDRVLVIVKQAITAVTIIALTLLMFNFIGVDLVNEYEDVVVSRSQMQYAAELEALADSGKEAHEITKAAEEAVANRNSIYTAIILPVVLVGAMVIVGGLISAVERFANKRTKLKTGELVPYKAMIALAVFVLIFAIVPTVFAVDSKDAREEAYKAGEFKIWYTEYQEEGTKLNIEYQLAKEIAEEGDEELAELREELKSAEGEKAEKLKEQIENGEKLLKEAEERVVEIEARAKRPTTCIITAVIVLIAEIAYLVVPKILKKKEDDTPAPEAPVAEEAAPAAE